MPQLLVVDDELMIRELLRNALTEKGYEVTSVSTGREALAAAGDKKYDLIIVDLELGAESGLTVLKELRRLQEKVPMVIYAGTPTPDLEREARVAGANELLGKDLEMPHFVEAIRKILQAKERIFEPPAKGDGKTILICDDEAMVRRVLVDFLKMKGFQVLEAPNGQTAIDLVRSQKPSFALLDIGLPDIDGLSVLKQVREIDPELGVVIMTGREGDETIKQAMDLGAYSYILKPFDFLYLEVVVLSKLAIAEGG